MATALTRMIYEIIFTAKRTNNSDICSRVFLVPILFGFAFTPDYALLERNNISKRFEQHFNTLLLYSKKTSKRMLSYS